MKVRLIIDIDTNEDAADTERHGYDYLEYEGYGEVDGDAAGVVLKCVMDVLQAGDLAQYWATQGWLVTDSHVTVVPVTLDTVLDEATAQGFIQ